MGGNEYDMPWSSFYLKKWQETDCRVAHRSDSHPGSGWHESAGSGRIEPTIRILAIPALSEDGAMSFSWRKTWDEPSPARRSNTPNGASMSSRL